jgi:hypothetical protein
MLLKSKKKRDYFEGISVPSLVLRVRRIENEHKYMIIYLSNRRKVTSLKL